MRPSPRKIALSAILFVLCVTTASSVVAQPAAKKPLFTETPMLCVGGGFVAMVPLGRPQSLVVIRIGSEGIEEPQTIPTTGNEVHGLKCVGSYVELLVVGTGSDHFSILPFSVQESGIQPQPREDINWSTSRKAPTPPEIERRLEAFYDILNTRGDWYVVVPRVANPDRVYEVHFFKTKKKGDSIFVVTLLEETLDRKVTRSVPLIREEVADVYD